MTSGERARETREQKQRTAGGTREQQQSSLTRERRLRRQSFAWLVLVTGCAGADPARAPASDPEAPRVTQVAPTPTPSPSPTNTADQGEPGRVSSPHGSVYSTRYISWIWLPRDEAKPKGRLVKLGFIRTGYGVPLRKAELEPGRNGCKRGYYAIEPRGLVCADRTTTTDPNHPVVKAMAESAPDRIDMADPESVYPYNYAFSIGAPMYERLPTEDQHRLVMMRFRERPLKLGDWAKGFEDLVDPAPIQPNGPMPTFVEGGGRSPLAGDGLVRKNLPHGSMVSYGRAFEAQGRVWLVTPDLTLVPAERVRGYRPSHFKGVELGEQQLPLAWARKQPRELFVKQGDELSPSGKLVEPGQALAVSAVEFKYKGNRYLRTRAGQWVRRDHFRVARQVKAPSAITNQRTWIYFSQVENTLVAYRGDTPVFATAQAPGRGGSHHGKGSVRNYTTPLGAFPINWKERWGTMSPDPGAPTSFWISDVMWTQYFKQPYAMHGAYWHESFGEKMSAGCPNLSPLDARWLFDFTEPKLPPGWQGIAPAPGEQATLVVLGS